MRNIGSLRKEVEGECDCLDWLESERARLTEVGQQITAARPGGHWDSTDSLIIFIYNKKRLKAFICKSRA